MRFLQEFLKSLFPFRISRFIPIFIVTGDLAFLISSFFGAVQVQGNSLESVFSRPVYYWFFLFAILSWFACVLVLKSFTIKRIKSLDRVAKDTIETLLYHIFLVSVYIVATEAYFIPRNYLLSFYSFFITGIFAWRFSIFILLQF